MAAIRHRTITYAVPDNRPLGPNSIGVQLPTSRPGDLLLAFCTGKTFPTTSGAGWQWSGANPLVGSWNYRDVVFVAYRYARAADNDGAENWTMDRSSGQDSGAVTFMSISGARSSNPINRHLAYGTADSPPTTVTAPSLLPAELGGLLLLFFGSTAQSGDAATISPAGTTNYVSSTRHKVYARQLPDTNATGLYSLSGWSHTDFTRGGALIVHGNAAPTAPTLLSPINNVTINRSSPQRFSWRFNDPNLPQDGQSRRELRRRIIGTTTWIIGGEVTPNGYADFPAGEFAAGQWEWQVRTFDNESAASPWSLSESFTATDPPAGPTITAPTNGATVAAQFTVTWTAGAQTAFQVQRVGDAGGSVDGNDPIFDSGQVNDATARSYTLSFPSNSQYEHIRVRVLDGLWSPWASVRVLVSYTSPAVPVLSVAPTKTIPSPYDFTDALSVRLLNGTADGAPDVAYLDLERGEVTEAGIANVLRVGTLLPPGTFTDHRVAHLVEYAYRATAVAASGASSTSEWVSDERDLGEGTGTPGGPEGDFADAEFSTSDFG